MALAPEVTLRVLEVDAVIPQPELIGKLWQVADGFVCITLGTSRVPVEVFGPGSWISSGALNICTPGALLSLTPSRLLCLPAHAAEDAFNSDASFARFIARVSMWRRQFTAQMLTLSRLGGSSARVVFGLALLAHSLSSSASHLPGNIEGNPLRIPLKQLLLADFFGLSRRVISSTFQSLSDGGRLRLEYGSVELLEPKVWEALYLSQVNGEADLFKKQMPELLRLMDQLAKGLHAQVA